MISVSHLDNIPTPKEVAEALVSPEARIEKDGRYPNRKGALGYYATVRSGDHWYMISVSDMLQPYHNQWWADRVGMIKPTPTPRKTTPTKTANPRSF